MLVASKVAYLIPVVGEGWVWWKWVADGWREARERDSGEICTRRRDCRVH